MKGKLGFTFIRNNACNIQWAFSKQLVFNILKAAFLYSFAA
jgi:hypothetical protein